MDEPVAPLAEAVTTRLRRCGNVYDLDGEPLRKVVGRPRTQCRLAQLEALNASLRGLLGARWPQPDDRRVRKTVGPAR